MTNFNLLNHIKNNDEYTVVWLFNIGLEKYWNGEVFTVKNSKEDIIVNHMEEMNLLITRKQDILILRSMPEKEYIDSMCSFGCEIPQIVCPSFEDENRSISEIVLEDDKLQDQIKQLIKDRKKVIFVPYGVSSLEESIAKKLELPLFGSANEINKMVNNKVFSRKFSLEHGFKVSEGKVCKGFSELEIAAKDSLEKYGKIIIKEPCGASGKGLWVVESPAKLKSTLLIIKRFFKDNLEGEWLVEQWCSKKADLNYQIYVGVNGEVEVFSIKEQKVDGTVYVGSVIPPDFNDALMKECIEAGEIIGKSLYEQGYRGILGVDAMILTNGELIPVIEINGRFTLSTYVSFIQYKNKMEDKKIFAFYKKIPLEANSSYQKLIDVLKDNRVWFDGKKGMFVYTAKTINKELVGENGRMFGLIFADDENEINEQYANIMNIILQEK
ncbi:MAG: ATP-grasp domain-containing protein [Lachnospiraceae bacterium]|nr:ATP-grasp domain-containing protein [Lachnospiraceae bacterium]